MKLESGRLQDINVVRTSPAMKLESGRLQDINVVRTSPAMKLEFGGLQSIIEYEICQAPLF